MPGRTSPLHRPGPLRYPAERRGPATATARQLNRACASLDPGRFGRVQDRCLRLTCPQRPPCSAGTGWRPMTRCSSRPAARGRIIASLHERLIELGPDELERRHKVADLTMRQQGITFTVYGREQGVERIIPFDPIPRLIDAAEWDRDRARAQAAGPGAQPVHSRRLPRAADPQGPGRAARAGLRRHRATAGECVGLQVPRDIYIHVSGIDLIRDADGSFLVLEDNCRTPSGVSYVLKNRQVMKQVFPLAVRAVQRAAGRRLHRQPAGGAPLDRARRLRRPHGRRPDARHVQLGLLRAQLPGPADGRRAGRGPRPGARPRPDLSPDDPGAPAGRRDLPPDRRRLPRSLDVSARQHAGRRRADRRVSRRQRRAGQRAGHRRRRRQGDLSVRSRHHPLFT